MLGNGTTKVGNPATLFMTEDATPTCSNATSGSTQLHDDARHPAEKCARHPDGECRPREKAPPKTKKNSNPSKKTVNIPVASHTRGSGAIKKIRNLVKVKTETTKREPRLRRPAVTPDQRGDEPRSTPAGHHPDQEPHQRHPRGIPDDRRQLQQAPLRPTTATTATLPRSRSMSLQTTPSGSWRMKH